jgi:hypothetical protein
MRTILFTLIVAVAACGGSSKPDTEEPAGGADPIAHEEGEEKHEEGGHPELTAEMHAFHDVLAPLWHSEAPDRQDKTCENAGRMLSLGEKIQDAPNPGADATAWAEAVKTLMVSIVKLMDECKAGGDFDANFGAVHDAFHGLMELLPKKAA